MTELSANPFQSSGNFTLVKSNPLSLVLKGSDGEAIPVEGLTSPIDILLPRKESLQVPISHWMIKSCYLFESNTSFVRKRTNVELKYCWLVRKPSLLMLRQEHFFACGRLWSLALLYVPQLHGESVKKKKKKKNAKRREICKECSTDYLCLTPLQTSPRLVSNPLAGWETRVLQRW